MEVVILKFLFVDAVLLQKSFPKEDLTELFKKKNKKFHRELQKAKAQKYMMMMPKVERKEKYSSSLFLVFTMLLCSKSFRFRISRNWVEWKAKSLLMEESLL